MEEKVYDGMRYPSVDELLKVINSKYKLAYVAAKRAQIMEAENGYTPLDDYLCTKSVGIALEEVIAGKTTMTFKKNTK